MNHKMIWRTLGYVLLILAALMLLPLIAGLWYGESVLNFIITIALTALAGLLLSRIRVEDSTIYARDGFVTVGLAWILMSMFGALPFVISGDIPNYIDALFETVSGFTTTGASVAADVESMSRGALFWRMFTHWIGGMGVLVFIMAVLPLDSNRSMHIMRAEVPGPVVGKLVPRMRDTAKILYLIYTVFTVTEAGFLMLGGMSFYEAVLHAFATAGTGGFSTRSMGLASFNSQYINTVVTVYLILFGTNFNLFYLMLIGRVREALKSEELHVYIALLLTASAVFVIGSHNDFSSLGTAIRTCLLTTINVVSTAGFTVVDYTQWPAFCQALIFILMFVGGCAGSTGGGLKLSRVMLLCKGAYADLQQMLRPRKVSLVKLDGKRVPDAHVRSVYAFFILYMLIILACTLIVSFDGFDVLTCLTASLSCISNVGPGLSLVGPLGSYAIFSPLSKLVMSVVMLIGRLEIYAILILFSPSVWKRQK